MEDNYSPLHLNIPKSEMPVNFKLAKEVPIHNWYTYKEGFSPSFVQSFINRFQTDKDNVVFDPFGGIGTTALEASIMGFSAESNDVNPLGNFASKIKSTIYRENELTEIQEHLDLFVKENIAQVDSKVKNETIEKYFHPTTLKNLLSTYHEIKKINSEVTRNLFILAFTSLLESFSTHRKDGNGVKKKTSLNEVESVFDKDDIKHSIVKHVLSYIDDIKTVKVQKQPIIHHQSSIHSYKLNSKADIVITSPPYANCFDYSKVYLIELWMAEFFESKNDNKIFRENSVSSHVHYKWDARNEKYGSDTYRDFAKPYLVQQKLWDKKIPTMLDGYFNDMGKVLYELSNNLNPGAHIGIVVGNSSYGGLPIPTDILLSEIAEKLGYTFIGIEVYRKLSTSSQQLKLLTNEEKNFLRESLIILKWQ